jgi:hypothetical protein
MKKIILTTIFLLFGVIGYSNTPIRFSVGEPTFKLDNVSPSKINLHLSSSRKVGMDRKNSFICVFIAGLAFTTASILEGGVGYGTWSNSLSSSSPSSTYVTPPFWKQTPRQIMMVVGVGFTITGGVGMMSKQNDY